MYCVSQERFIPKCILRVRDDIVFLFNQIAGYLVLHGKGCSQYAS